MSEGRAIRNRSRITNGAVVNADGRSAWGRRMRDLIHLHLSDLGGADATSEAEKSIIRRVAVLTCELERMEAVFAEAGASTPEELDLYNRTAGNMRRLLEAVGLERRSKDITPSLDDIAAEIQASKNEE